MAVVRDTVAAIRINGDDLVPAEVTTLLGADPTGSHAKGDAKTFSPSGATYPPWRSGNWHLSSEHSESGDLDGQICDLLSRVTSDLAIWRQLKERFEVDMHCGLFMALPNEVCVLSAETLRALGDRGIKLFLELYDPSEEPARNQPCPCAGGDLYSECHGYRGKELADVEKRFYAGERTERVRFAVGDTARIVSGPRASQLVTVLELVAIEPVTVFRVELIEAPQGHLGMPQSDLEATAAPGSAEPHPAD
jgi:hypothetical protein